jgi:hypothetical protein
MQNRLFKNQFSVLRSQFSDVQLSQTCQEFFEMFVCHGTVLPATDRVAEVNGLCNGRLQSHKGLSS